MRRLSANVYDTNMTDAAPTGNRVAHVIPPLPPCPPFASSRTQTAPLFGAAASTPPSLPNCRLPNPAVPRTPTHRRRSCCTTPLPRRPHLVWFPSLMIRLHALQNMMTIPTLVLTSIPNPYSCSELHSGRACSRGALRCAAVGAMLTTRARFRTSRAASASDAPIDSCRLVSQQQHECHKSHHESRPIGSVWWKFCGSIAGRRTGARAANGRDSRRSLRCNLCAAIRFSESRQ